jgi:putative cell wall-binding protein
MTLAAELAKRLSSEPAGAGTSVYVKGLSVDRASSGFVRRADILWSNGAVTPDVAGTTIQFAANLPSTKFYLGGPYERIALGDRYETAAQISRSAFPTAGSAAVAIVVNGTDAKFPDALSASSLGGVANGPVLLTRVEYLSNATRSELARLKPQKVYVIGGTASVPSAVLKSVRSAVPAAAVVRLDGADRYEVAARVAREVKALGVPTTSVMIASGEKWPDSAIAAAAAATAKRPLILVSGRGLPKPAARALQDLGVTQTAVFGGQATLPSGVIKQILAVTHESAPYKRFGVNGTRYDEAVAAAGWCVSAFGATLSQVYIASGETFPDSVTGGVLAASTKHPLLLTTRATANQATLNYLSRNRAAISKITILGGSGSVSNKAASDLGGAAY